jgi:hypothetical protein
MIVRNSPSLPRGPRLPYDRSMRRFGVDEVVAARERLQTHSLGSRYPTAFAVGGDAETAVIDHGHTHPLLAAVGIAFAQHRPLVLSPDAVWLTIAQGVAQHVRLHAEALRKQLVRHADRKQLQIRTNTLPTDSASWMNAIAMLRAVLGTEIGGHARLFECNFSTSSDVDLLASQVVLLDAYSPYFSFHIEAVCGIPEVTLLGTVDDWRSIRSRIDVVRELDLELWCRSLAPITDQLVRAAAGDIDLPFWRRIYNPQDAYGGELITGWITRFYPYVEAHGTLDVPNPMLELALDEPRNLTTTSDRDYAGPGLRSSSIPASVSRVRICLENEATNESSAVAVVAGVVAVEQDEQGALRPIAGWWVEPSTPNIDDVIERVLRDHAAVLAAQERRIPPQGPADVVALFTRIETATLFTGDRQWTLCGPSDQRSVSFERSGQYWITRIAEIAGGRSLCFATNRRADTTLWITCRLQENDNRAFGEIRVFPGSATAIDPPEEIRVLRGSFASILEFALDSNGDIDALEVGRFDELLRVR